MKGWKTKAAAAAFALLGVVDIANGDIQGGMEKIAGALALLGIGHKVEKGFGGEMLEAHVGEIVTPRQNPPAPPATE